jgi:hypothetical protein
MVPPHLIVRFDGFAVESLLEDWRWLVPTSHAPILMTALGDLFLLDDVGRVHFLDMIGGEMKLVASSRNEFEQKCESREHRQNWFIGSLVLELQKRHGQLAMGQCFSCKVPLSLGGQLDTENFEPCDIHVHCSVLGQIHRQTKGLPPGTIIRKVSIE